MNVSHVRLTEAQIDLPTVLDDASDGHFGVPQPRVDWVGMNAVKVRR